MNTDDPTLERQEPAPQSRRSLVGLEREVQQLRARLLTAQAELEEAGEVERFLRLRARDLNTHLRVMQSRIAELENNPGPDAATDDEPGTDTTK